MKRLSVRSKIHKLIPLLFIVLPLAMGAGQFFFPSSASAAELSSRSLQLSDDTAGAQGVTYNLSFTTTTPGAIGSIAIEFCSNSTFITDPCTAPYGLDTLNAQMTYQSGVTGFQISNTLTTGNEIVLSRPSQANVTTPARYVFTGITNPSDQGSYYVRVITYASSDTSGPDTDFGGMAYAIENGISLGVSTEVPPYLTFCVANTIPSYNLDCTGESGDYIDLGNFNSGSASSGTTQLMTATNAGGGYSIYVQGDTLTSGNNTIPASTTAATSQVGISQFGMNLRSNSDPSVGSDPEGPGQGEPEGNYDIPNKYAFNSGDIIAASSHSDDFRRYTVSYIVNINKTQPVGVYASTFTYICLANF